MQVRAEVGYRGQGVPRSDAQQKACTALACASGVDTSEAVPCVSVLFLLMYSTRGGGVRAALELEGGGVQAWDHSGLGPAG